jgi:uncharacterized delta-60 repeat protein
VTRTRRRTHARAHTVAAERLEPRALLAGNPLDPAFGGGDGIVIPDAGGPDVAPAALAVQPDGKLLAAGTLLAEGADDFVLARYNPDGSVDTAFGNHGRVVTDFGGRDDQARSVWVDADGKIVVTGSSNATYAVARYNPDGSYDTRFGGGGTVLGSINGFIGAGAPAPGGKLILFGSQPDNQSPYGIPAVVRLSPDGSPDPTFGTGGLATYVAPGTTDDWLSDVAVQGDGKVVLAGYVHPYSPDVGPLFARLNENGMPDSSFDSNGGFKLGYALALQPDGKVLVGGRGTAGPGLWRVGANGGLDPTFGQSGERDLPFVQFATPSAVRLQPDGKIVVQVLLGGVARVNPDGSMDNTFGGGDGATTLPDDAAFRNAIDAVITPSGRIVALGTGSFGAHNDLSLTALTPAGDPDPSFHFEGNAAVPRRTGRFSDVAVLPDGRLLAVGSSDGGAYLARFLPDGSPDPAFGPLGQRVYHLGGPVTRVVLMGDGRFLAFGNILARFNADGTPDTTFGGGDGVVIPSAPGDGLALQPDGKILTVEGSGTSAKVTRYNADGSLDTAFGTGGRVGFNLPLGSAPDNDGQPYTGFVPTDVAWQAATGKIVVGGQTPGFNPLTDFAAVRLSTNGTIDMAFANGTGMASADTGDIDLAGRMAVSADGTIYLTGEEEDEDPHLIVFGRDGNSTSTRRLPYSGDTADLDFGPNGLVVVGDTESYDSNSGTHHDIVVTRFDPLAPTQFQTDVLGASNDFPFGVAVEPDGDVVVAGSANPGPGFDAVTESPVLLRYAAEAFDAPQVQQAYVDGSGWAPAFRQEADRNTFANPAYGVGLFDGQGKPRFRTVPWINVNRVAFTFDRPVTVQPWDLVVHGVNVADYPLADFRYDANTRTAVWTFAAPLGPDRLTLQLGQTLGNLQLKLNVLPGDVTGDGKVLADDYSQVKSSFFTTPTNAGTPPRDYQVRRDVDGSGDILAYDFSEVKKRFFTELPAAAQFNFVSQSRVVQAIPDSNPPPTNVSGGPQSQQASGFGPFAASVDVIYYWGQEGYDYGGSARVTQTSTLSPTGIAASGLVHADGDTVSVTGRSLLSITFDVEVPTPYALAVKYDLSGYSGGGGGPNGVVALRRVDAGGNVTLVRHEATFFDNTFPPDQYDTTDAGVLAPGRYTLDATFQMTEADFGSAGGFTYDVRLTAPQPSATAASVAAVSPSRGVNVPLSFARTTPARNRRPYQTLRDTDGSGDILAREEGDRRWPNGSSHRLVHGGPVPRG